MEGRFRRFERQEDSEGRLEANLEDLLSLLVIKSLREDKVQKEKESGMRGRNFSELGRETI